MTRKNENASAPSDLEDKLVAAVIQAMNDSEDRNMDPELWVRYYLLPALKAAKLKVVNAR